MCLTPDSTLPIKHQQAAEVATRPGGRAPERRRLGAEGGVVTNNLDRHATGGTQSEASGTSDPGDEACASCAQAWMPQENPIRSRINAAFFHCTDWYAHWKYAERKRRLFADLPLEVLEIGSGTGANMRYFRPGTRIIAAEPNRHMHDKLRQRAQRYDVDLEILSAPAEALPLTDASVDAVVASLVLCTVEYPRSAVREILRVLRPGGRFLCIEHVAAPADSLVGFIQRLVYRPWSWLFEGCDTHRDTADLLRTTDFSRVDIREFTLRSAFVPIRPQIEAECVK